MLSNEIKSEISAKINELRDEIARDFAKQSDIPDVSGLATKTELTDYAKIKELPDLSPYLKSQYADDNFALKNDIPDISGLAKASDIPDVSSYLTSNDISNLESKVNSNKHFYENGDFFKIIRTNDWNSYPYELIKTITIPASHNKARTKAVHMFSDWIVTAATNGGGQFHYKINRFYGGKEHEWIKGILVGKVVTYPLVFFDSPEAENQDLSYKLYVKPIGNYLHLKGRFTVCVM